MPLTRSRSVLCLPCGKQRRPRKRARTKCFQDQRCDEHVHAVQQVQFQLQLDDDSDVPPLISSSDCASDTDTEDGGKRTNAGGRTSCRPPDVARSRSRSPPPGTDPGIVHVEPTEACPPVPLTCIGNQPRNGVVQTASQDDCSCEFEDEFDSTPGCQESSLGYSGGTEKQEERELASRCLTQRAPGVLFTSAENQPRCGKEQVGRPRLTSKLVPVDSSVSTNMSLLFIGPPEGLPHAGSAGTGEQL